MAPNSDFFIFILNNLAKEMYDFKNLNESNSEYIVNIFILMEKVIDNG